MVLDCYDKVHNRTSCQLHSHIRKHETALVALLAGSHIRQHETALVALLAGSIQYSSTINLSIYTPICSLLIYYVQPMQLTCMSSTARRPCLASAHRSIKVVKVTLSGWTLIASISWTNPKATSKFSACFSTLQAFVTFTERFACLGAL